MTDAAEKFVEVIARWAESSDGSSWRHLISGARAYLASLEKPEPKRNTFEILPGGYVGVRCERCGHKFTKVRSDDEPEPKRSAEEIISYWASRADTAMNKELGEALALLRADRERVARIVVILRSGSPFDAKWMASELEGRDE